MSTATGDARHDRRGADAFSLENPDPLRWKALGVLGVAQLMIVLDGTIVNLALPRAKAELGITDVDQQWILTAYTLAFGGLLLLGGRIADYAGRKRVFIIGLLGFALASALGALTPNAALLYGARGLQGAFAALMAPAALSLMTVTFHDPKERARGFGVFGAVAGGGAAVGLLLGGVLTEYLSWRWCLLINTPIALVAALLAVRYTRESRATGHGSYDVVGAITVTVGLVALVYGLTRAAPGGLHDTAHWGEPTTLAWFALAAVLLVAFFVIESRHPNPLLPLRVLLDRNRGGSYLIMLIVGIGMFAMFLFLGLYLQVVKGYTPIAAGFAFLPFSAGIVVGAGIASQLVPRVGPKPVLVPGLLLGAVGMFWLSRITVDSGYATTLLPAMLVLSIGMAFMFIPITTTGLHGVGHEDAGVASALINTSQQIGGSVGVALLNTVAVIATTSFLAENVSLGPVAVPEALTARYTRAFLVGALINLFAAGLAAWLLTIGREAASEDDEQPVVHAG